MLDFTRLIFEDMFQYKLSSFSLEKLSEMNTEGKIEINPPETWRLSVDMTQGPRGTQLHTRCSEAQHADTAHWAALV